MDTPMGRRKIRIFGASDFITSKWKNCK